MVNLSRFRNFCLMLLCLYHINGYGQTKHLTKHLRVIVFLDTECPISQSYMPELRRLSKEYETRDVKFEAIFPVYTVTKSEINDFFKKYQISFPGTPDKDHFITKRFKATTMPEVLLLNRNGIVVYRGAIDNFYVALGKNRSKPSEFYLKNAIEATLSGNVILKPQTEAIGCLINQ